MSGLKSDMRLCPKRAHRVITGATLGRASNWERRFARPLARGTWEWVLTGAIHGCPGGVYNLGRNRPCPVLPAMLSIRWKNDDGWSGGDLMSSTDNGQFD